jgi:hypothetical protein
MSLRRTIRRVLKPRVAIDLETTRSARASSELVSLRRGPGGGTSKTPATLESFRQACPPWVFQYVEGFEP